MVQHNDWHPNITQLSAYIDQQLSPQELATLDAHLHTCQQCQSALADLRATVALLRAMPEPVLPRSFTLSPDIRYLQERPANQPQQRPAAAPSRRPLPFYARRSLRAVSTLVAVIGLIFILTSAFAALPHYSLSGGAPTSMSNHGASQQMQSATTPSAHAPACSLPAHNPCATPRAQTPQTPGSTTSAAGSATKAPSRVASPPPTSAPSTFDPTSPSGRLLVGSALLLLGLAGFILTKRQPRQRLPRQP